MKKHISYNLTIAILLLSLSSCNIERSPKLFGVLGIMGNKNTTSSNFKYTGSPFTFTKNVKIATAIPTVVGTLSNCSIDPILPIGLNLDNSTCDISGTPANVQALTEYTVTGKTTNGESNTTIGILVVTTASFYSVSGTLVQLGSPSLILQNNSGDNLSVTSNGQFTFSSSIADGSNYSVTVFTQPTNQICQVSNGSGTITSANITNIIVTCTGNANGALVNGSIINTLGALVGGVTTLAGSWCNPITDCGGNAASIGFFDSTNATSVMFDVMDGITTDGYNIYVGDPINHRIRKIIIATGETTTLVGSGVLGQLDGIGTAAQLNDPVIITTDGVYVYFCEKANPAIRKIQVSTGILTTLLSGTPAVWNPTGIVLYNNKLYISDETSDALLQYDLSTSSLTTVIPTGLNNPFAIALIGNIIYISDEGTNQILKATIGVWAVSFVAGGTAGNLNGIGAGARFNGVEGMTTDGTNLFLTDGGNNAIRKIAIPSNIVTTVAGPLPTGNLHSYINNSSPTISRFFTPKGLTSDGASLYVIDQLNYSIRKIQ